MNTSPPGGTFYNKLGVPGWGRHFLSLAAAAVVVAATVITAATVVSSAIVATAAEQDQQDDDPAPVTTTEAVIAHTKYLHTKIITAGLPLIPRYSIALKMCSH